MSQNIRQYQTISWYISMHHDLSRYIKIYHDFLLFWVKSTTMSLSHQFLSNKTRCRSRLDIRIWILHPHPMVRLWWRYWARPSPLGPATFRQHSRRSLGTVTEVRSHKLESGASSYSAPARAVRSAKKSRSACHRRPAASNSIQLLHRIEKARLEGNNLIDRLSTVHKIVYSFLVTPYHTTKCLSPSSPARWPKQHLN